MVALSTTLGIDFGTSNSAAGVAINGMPHLIDIEPGEKTLPTAVFFDFDAKQTVFGRPAQAALIGGDEGRYMRALKSLLGTSLMRESRVLLGKRMDFIEIVGRFLAEIKARAEAATGQKFHRALSGRPVMFHSADTVRNAQALVDLTDCYHAAGFTDVRFMPEPEAAALANRAFLNAGDLGLIVDIGGGTSDFTLFRQQGDADIDILASNGLRLGGTDFDRELSLAHVMPHLGMGSDIKHMFGGETHVAPQSMFADLATWQKIPFLYTRETCRAAEDLARHAVEPGLLARLVTVLEQELGHDLAFAVEAAKIAANDPNGTAPPEIKLDMLERGLNLPLPAAMMAATLAQMAGKIADAAMQTVDQAGLAKDDVSRLIFVGGSSLMGVVDAALRREFPKAEVHQAAALTGVVDGLALAAAAAFD
ncbi:Hsp70 family protein [Sulfitobacter sp. SK011]|uniref:Hsp70 family protein n=1 Tax=Sulfitobacter sp. SK011 TaxID=1389004 RepID=UPI000E0BB60E|nr:Hsp70 family protein [Sulfitobacter sp. SK011]AXI40555.1 hsp70 family protein [Sulfitobacter sp. SK011]